MQNKKHDDALRKTIYKIIFHTDTPAGKLFDVILLITILFSVLVVMLDSVKEIRDDYIDLLYAAEWTITIIFTLEYILRILFIRIPGDIFLVSTVSLIYWQHFQLIWRCFWPEPITLQ